MALSTSDLADLRRALARDTGPVRWNKDQVNTAFQEIDTLFTAFKATVRPAVNSASGFTFTVAEVQEMGRLYLGKKFDLGG